MNIVQEGRSYVYEFHKQYLQHLLEISKATVIIHPSCQDPQNPTVSSANTEPEKPECPFDLKIDLIIGDITMDCQKFGININAGISFAAEKNFDSKESTLAIGVGIGISKELQLPIIGIEGGAGISEQLYIVFDGNNNPSDIGLKMEAGVKISAGGSLGPLSTEIGDTEAQIGYTLGLNSGWNFSGSALGTSLKL
jgi:hypothetical protein